MGGYALTPEPWITKQAGLETGILLLTSVA